MTAYKPDRCAASAFVEIIGNRELLQSRTHSPTLRVCQQVPVLVRLERLRLHVLTDVERAKKHVRGKPSVGSKVQFLFM